MGSELSKREKVALREPGRAWDRLVRSSLVIVVHNADACFADLGALPFSRSLPRPTCVSTTVAELGRRGPARALS